MNNKTEELLLKVEETVRFIRKHTDAEPEVGIILGTGLGRLADEIDIETELHYSQLPNFPVSTVESHKGRLLFGKLSGKNVVAMQGRFHYYEGYNMTEITFPIRVMKFLGIKNLLISNASGSMNPYIRKGQIMIIEDHINLTGNNPLIGINDSKLGIRFPDMSEPWSKRLIKLAERIAMEIQLKVHKGVYVAVAGPSLETRAEYRFLRLIGADVVGMSTVPENIVARQMGIEVLGLSVITDECYPDALEPCSLEDILENAASAEPFLTRLMLEVLKSI
ncbi:purine-nucleoside phosphorylase [Bacteroidetes/Chlorobi group bacterium ChocPot_Mid]|jgi:purine-nucleoside phosphorylase|nr:MAG: purine-nucleoside phosphorylase [Bacteroidetes/Chlorobi group bacterium ChocPot_Mid]